MIDLGKLKKVTAVLKLKTQFSPKGLSQNLLEVKKIMFLSDLNDGVDQTFGIFFYHAVSIELFGIIQRAGCLIR